ncbi:hypothetical protein BJX61DRAFT_541559 [Aspergillus egyptiacus]|nr:hypothetical protein BJX61DRAFT_541559 [Aspergillus egyptiacus]
MSSLKDSPHDYFSKLPVELVLSIIEYLVQDNQGNELSSEAFPVARPAVQTLLSLTLTSKSFHALIQPYLYRTVFCSRPWQHRRLLRSLITSPSLAEHVKYLVFFEHTDWTPFTNEPDPTKSSQRGTFKKKNGKKITRYRRISIFDDEPDLRPLWDRISGSGRKRPLGTFDIDTRDAALALLGLLRRLPQLKRFFFIGKRGDWTSGSYAIPISARVARAIPFHAIFVRMAESLQRLSKTRNHNQALEAPFLKNLEALHVRHVGTKTWPLFLSELLCPRSLNTVELTPPDPSDGLRLYPGTFPDSLPHCQIRSLQIVLCPMFNRSLATLLKDVESLNCFHLDIRYSMSNEAGALFGQWIVQALQPRQETLRELRIRGIAMRNFLQVPDPDWTSLTELVVLDVPDTLLYNEQMAMETLVQCLPPKLEELVVRLMGVKPFALPALRGIAQRSDERRSLRRVTARDEADWERPLTSGMAELERVFAARGIDFVHEVTW